MVLNKFEGKVEKKNQSPRYTLNTYDFFKTFVITLLIGTYSFWTYNLVVVITLSTNILILNTGKTLYP